ncbi:hypothetical protein [Pseudoalteromonas phenolica]|uniref:Uncharacterized protein n=1 Tax=Pseudoalteromonas phenolica TaxID=161398 RepID=A0A0S2K706_9GAMM|nr:hypothetical protein [Pseudoalteromonas phenolica]ALO43870.1 hypothetical protein PP2015_3395 [Pseudoalteromonas phenolica]MBE0356838.1 hypothetical protein [Pseudoalteromonas phenolica O-BC30]RXF07045.1 hypothetical protein D9981_00555 [Pseudoalteromonas phenolica O-BC30]TMO55743.1 hypothetical protein CWC21_09875 [Pseudoalteromonas phenolica]
MSQPTLKHGDWAKIIEARQKQNSSPKAQNSSLKFTFIGLVFLAIFAVFYWTSLPATQAQTPLSDESQTRIARYFSKQFMMGTWQLDEVKFSEYGVITHVRVPKKLNMDGEVLSNYIQHSLCPPASSLVWQDIKAHQLTMNLFVSLQRKGQKAKCDNPNSIPNS